MQRYSLILFLLLGISINSRSQGIQFEQGDWSTIKAKAKAAHKLVYIDVFTSWCGPCKMMARNYFPQEQAGTFYNGAFVCYQIDAEKGEGVAIAKQYAVNGYPTNLFINPANEQVVFRTMGMPQTITAFVENGQIAQMEFKDPKTLNDYEKQYASGKYDESFLRNYMEKNHRLSIDNDKLLDIYLDKYAKSQPEDSLILMVSRFQTGVTNKSYAYLGDHQKRLNTLMKDNNYFSGYSNQYYNQSMEKAIKEKDEPQFRKLIKRIDEFFPEDPKFIEYQFTSQFYKGTENQAKLVETENNYADYLMAMSDQERNGISAKGLAGMKAQIRWQAGQMGVDSSKLDEVVAQNLQRPEVKYMKELIYAQTLNATAWEVYENNKAGIQNKERVQKALLWSKKAMDLSEPVPGTWMAVADTRAHLLAINGDKEGARKLEQSLVDKATSTNDPGLKDYQAYLNELR